MLVSQIMNKNIVAVLPTVSIQEAAKKMREKNAEAVVVLEGSMFRGMLTERQVATALAADTEVARLASADEMMNCKTTVNADGDRCRYFNEVMVDLLLDAG